MYRACASSSPSLLRVDASVIPTGEALVDDLGAVWLPHDIAKSPLAGRHWSPLSSCRASMHAGRLPFSWSPPRGGTLSVLNGMGVTLGDSIIGLGVLAWLKQRDPSLRIEVWRSRCAPAFVERLYALADGVVDRVHRLPQPLHTLPSELVDLSDFLHWPSFAALPMVDFFVAGVGLSPQAMPDTAKANRWLALLPVAPTSAAAQAGRYVLFCADASTPLRSVPGDQAAAMVEQIWQRYRLPVCGFRAIAHPRYHDVSSLSPDLDAYLGWVRSAQLVVSTDSSALHIAAGFDRPTLALFTGIAPKLRVRDYPLCRSLDIGTPATRGLHESREPLVLAELHAAWAGVLARSDCPWPETERRARAFKPRRVPLPHLEAPQRRHATVAFSRAEHQLGR
jgi:Glycosyltransferase family 9 (heptosyltransferase)